MSSKPKMLPRRLKLIGVDPSLRNWGLAWAAYDTVNHELDIIRLDSLHPDLPKGKQVRQNSLDLESAQQLFAGTAAFVAGAHAVFVEVPVGSQSARAMASYGICVGILGSLRASGTPFLEVTPSEVKLATGLKKTASKREMIDWAVKRHPAANWPTYMEHGKTLVSEAKAEHQADAVAAIYAGLNLNQFKQMLAMRMAA
jgi:hypothetical protein